MSRKNPCLIEDSIKLTCKKKSIHQYFNHLRSLGNFNPTNPIYIALVNYEAALLEEIDFLGAKNEHPQACVFLLEDIIRAALTRQTYIYHQKLQEFIETSQNSKYYPRLRMAAISLAIALICIGALALSLWFFSPAGILFLTAVFTTTILMTIAIVTTNYLLVSRFYQPIFQSQKKANELVEAIDWPTNGLSPSFFRSPVQNLRLVVRASIEQKSEHDDKIIPLYP